MTTPSDRGVLRTVSRVGLVRLLFTGFPLLLGLGLVLAFHFEYPKGGLGPYRPEIDYAGTLALTGVLLGGYALLIRLFEGRWPEELALRTALSWTGLGAAIGFGLVAVVYALFTVLGVVSWQGVGGTGAIGPILLLAVVAGVGEELLFRGVLFRVLEESFGSTAALVLSAAVFGLMHAGTRAPRPSAPSPSPWRPG
jgi:membrane protease YdiL (CAAX protease family)